MPKQSFRVSGHELQQGLGSSAQGKGVSTTGRLVDFKFDGKSLTGHVGDTLAAALLANGIHLVGRSFKYHRPRGIVGAGAEEQNALVQVGRDGAETMPNVRASELEIYEGLEVFSQNRWPSLKYDFGSITDRLSRFIPAGFYYKTFMGPLGNWMFFEPFIRRAAGLGRSPTLPDPDHYEHINHHCDVLVVGGGPAGLAAARQAASMDSRVLLVDENPSFGGSLLADSNVSDSSTVVIEDTSGKKWVDTVLDELRQNPNVTILNRTCAVGYHADNWLALSQKVSDHVAPIERLARVPRHRLWRVRAKQVVLATGAIERPLVFQDNDRPGIMLASAVRRYLNQYGVKAGNAVVLFTNNTSAYQTAFDLSAAGVGVQAIVDTRSAVEDELAKRASRLGIPVFVNCWIVGTKGRRRITSVDIRHSQRVGAEAQLATLSCDVLAVSGGLSPNVALFSQSRGKLRWDDEVAAFRPAMSWQNEISVGACAADFDLSDALSGGARAGFQAAITARQSRIDDGSPESGTAGVSGDNEAVDSSASGTEMSEAKAASSASIKSIRCSVKANVPYSVQTAWHDPQVPLGEGTAFVDFQNDVTVKDLCLAVREGYASVEHAKRYTTLGMATDQGKTSSVNGFGILSKILDKPMSEIGITTMRPPYKPLSFGSVAGQHVGDLYHPRRTTAMHQWHAEAGATFEVVGDWLRARVYPVGTETFEQALQRESRAAREGVAVLDASTLGKIDIRGSGAREFLNRIYTNSWMKLKPSFCRYGLMLNEDGMIFDDGVTACLADDHFHMTTTTGGAARVLSWLEDYHQTEWSHLPVYMTSVTEQWAVAAICGPKSPELLAELLDDGDADPATFPFMSVRSATISGIPVRLFRISFTGEMSYEVNVPARYGLWLWREIMAKGAKFGITPYGTEAMHLLRAEKGFIIVGQDTDGTATPHDMGMSWAVKKNADFVGCRSLSRSDTARSDRRQFVGLRPVDSKWVSPEGAQIIGTKLEADRGKKTPMIGYVTSAYYSPTLDGSIALGLIDGGFDRMGEVVHIARPNGTPMPAKICNPDFLADTAVAR